MGSNLKLILGFCTEVVHEAVNGVQVGFAVFHPYVVVPAIGQFYETLIGGVGTGEEQIGVAYRHECIFAPV